MAFTLTTQTSKPSISENGITSKCLTSKFDKTPILKNDNEDLSNSHDEKIITKTAKTKSSSSSNENAETLEQAYSYKIWRSETVVKKPQNVIKERKWESLDVVSLSGVAVVHVLALFAPFAFNWAAFWVAFVLYCITMCFGICLSYHRQLSHKSFKLPKWLEYFFAYCGALSQQGHPISWVSNHRYHHQLCDTEKDPHSPVKGFWFSHMNWMFDTRTQIKRHGDLSNVKDLEEQFFYRFLRDTYVLHVPFLGSLLYAFGGFPYLVWGMGVRTICVYHVIWGVNSIGHIWGTRAWNSGDLSTNNWWMALISFGEGWHNNHHAFGYSARHGLEWWQLDMTWYLIKFLEIIGLARDVKLPTETHKQRLALKKVQ